MIRGISSWIFLDLVSFGLFVLVTCVDFDDARWMEVTGVMKKFTQQCKMMMAIK